MSQTYGEENLESMSQAIWYNRWSMKKFTPYLRGEILEVGCGIGNFSKALTKYGQVWAIDINQNYLKKIRERISQRIIVGYGDIEKGRYFFNKKTFDAIVCLNVLEHIKDDNKAIANLSKLLKPGGHLIVLIPAHPAIYGKIDSMVGHYRRYTKEEIIGKIKRVNLNILRYRRLNFLGAIGWFIVGKILRENKIEYGKIKIFNFLAPFILPIEDLIEPPVGTSILVIARK